MTILAYIDGPKCTGKSTVAKALAEMYDAKIVKFDSKMSMTRDLILDLSSSDTNYIVERGYLSSMIYGFIRNAEYDARIYGDTIYPRWKPTNKGDLDTLFGNVLASAVFFASSPDHLRDRLVKRLESQGVTFTDEEFNDLKESNDLFAWYSEMFRSVYQSYDIMPINTSCLTIEQSIARIQNKIDYNLEMRKDHQITGFEHGEEKKKEENNE